MEKDTLIGAGVLTVIVIAVLGYAALRPAPVTAPGTPTATNTSPTLELTGVTYNEHAPYFDITASYASSTPLGGSANEAAVTLMKKFVADTITGFNDGNFDNLTAEDIKMRGFDQGRKESLDIKYLMGSGAHTVSYIFTIYQDTGGAHGITYFKTFTFDKSSGNLLLLGDLFAPRTDYLGTLSQLATARLPQVIGDEMFDINAMKDGTTPTEKHFQNFFIDNSDFVVLFNPYQVAAYAAGPQTLRLPLSLLKDILKSQYR